MVVSWWIVAFLCCVHLCVLACFHLPVVLSALSTHHHAGYPTVTRTVKMIIIT